MKYLSPHLALLLVLLLSGLFSWGQVGKTRIRGRVLDSSSGEPIAYATVAIKGTVSGTISDDEGRFFLTSTSHGDTLAVAYVGYKTEEFAIKTGHFQELEVRLRSLEIEMDEVRVYRDERPIRRLLDSVFHYRDRHNPDRQESYRCRVYNKLQIDVNNVDTAFLRRGVLGQLRFVGDHLDTNAATGKSFIPVFLSESVSRFYYSRSPRMRKELIEASQLSGVENEDYAQFTGALHQDFNIYNNFITVFNQGLVSPLNGSGWSYYEYFLVDSAGQCAEKRYQVSFRPRRRYEPTFRGYVWIDSGSYAVVEAQYELARDANLNFVNYVMGQEDYQQLSKGKWFPRRKHFFMDLNLEDRQVGLFGHKTTLYDSVEIPTKIPTNLRKEVESVLVKEGAQSLSAEEWDAIRPASLSKQERGIYEMVDSVKQLPIYRSGRFFWLMMLERHIPLRYVDIGPWPRIYANNGVEGHRFTFGFRTNRDLMSRVQLWALGGYGVQDRRWKWETGALWVMKRKPWRTFRFNMAHEVEVLGQGRKVISENNLLGAILRERRNDKLTLVDRVSLSYFHEWHTGLSTEVTFCSRTIYPTVYVPFVMRGGISLPALHDAYAQLEFRWKHRERFASQSFYRQSLGSDWPEVSFSLRGAVRSSLGAYVRSDFSYLHLGLRVRQKVHFNPVGYSWILLESGHIFGRVPYPLLRLHEGNGTYALNRYHFNMLQHYEFVSDRWVSLLWEHHFMGLILNHVPYLRRLNWREVVTAKILWGDAREENLHYFVSSPGGLSALGKEPYVELSGGIENIFHLLRVDGVWRLTHRRNSRSHHFTVRLGIAVQF